MARSSFLRSVLSLVGSSRHRSASMTKLCFRVDCRDLSNRFRLDFMLPSDLCCDLQLSQMIRAGAMPQPIPACSGVVAEGFVQTRAEGCLRHVHHVVRACWASSLRCHNSSLQSKETFAPVSVGSSWPSLASLCSFHHAQMVAV